jgi:branched-chain amino acid aminotransferase
MVNNFEWRAGSLIRRPDTTDFVLASAILPEGAYTTLRTYRGRGFLRLDEHVARLARSAGAALAGGELRAALRGALDATRHPESRLRVTFAPPRLFVSVEPFVGLAKAVYEDGVRCATVPLQRERPEAKDTRFLAAAATVYRGLPVGVHEGLLVAEDGAILEGLSSNFFAVIEGALRTEDARALPGITRSLVLDTALGVVPVVLAAPTRHDLASMEECFVTSASRGILPVIAIDDSVIGTGRPGPVTAKLRQGLEERIAVEAEPL